jgi:hypothetical protein
MISRSLKKLFWSLFRTLSTNINTVSSNSGVISSTISASSMYIFVINNLSSSLTIFDKLFDLYAIILSIAFGLSLELYFFSINSFVS